MKSLDHGFFRYYLDRQAIYYIRSHYEGATDYEKLLAYGKENNIEFDYTTGSNYHNRFTPKDGFKRPYNMKVQVLFQLSCFFYNGPFFLEKLVFFFS